MVENYSPRVMANLELDYGTLKKLKPDIIMLSMSVMGQTGPWCNYTGFGPTVQLDDGTLVTCYSYAGTGKWEDDSNFYTEVVRWRLP